MMKKSDNYITADMTEKSFNNEGFIDLVRTILGHGKAIRFRAQGYSMAPFIRDGDVITLGPVQDKIHQGDVIAFVKQQSGKLVIHRVVGMNRESFILKGDNLYESDGFVDRADILGKVICVEKSGSMRKLGLGRERRVIALLSRLQCLKPMLVTALKIRSVIQNKI